MRGVGFRASLSPRFGYFLELFFFFFYCRFRLVFVFIAHAVLYVLYCLANSLRESL